MSWFVVLLAVTVLDLAWVSWRARREWSRGDDLATPTAVAINSLYLLAVALIVVALVVRPWPLDIPLAVAVAFGGALICAGIAVAVVGARPFGSSARLYGVDAGGLIEGGIYRFSRNPQYVGLALVVLGVGLAARSGLTLAVAAVIISGFWLWVVAVEEPHLERTFGDRYARYRRDVPRFLGLPLNADEPSRDARSSRSPM